MLSVTALMFTPKQTVTVQRKGTVEMLLMSINVPMTNKLKRGIDRSFQCK